jgi:hypothetical protein
LAGSIDFSLRYDPFEMTEAQFSEKSQEILDLAEAILIAPIISARFLGAQPQEPGASQSK